MLSLRGARPVAWLTLDRPEKLNAMTRDFFAELASAHAAEADGDRAVRVVVVHGAGKCFSVGGDIEGFGELGGDRLTGARTSRRRSARSARSRRSPKPTIAAVHGHALGGGCELTMVCDLVVADETARFGMPEAGGRPLSRASEPSAAARTSPCTGSST